MKWLRNKLSEYYSKQIDGTGLALFRITFCMVMMLELLHSMYFSDMMFNSPNIMISLIVWFIVLFFIMIGAFTRVMSAINYVLCIVIILQQTHGYHMNYAYFGVSLFFIILPISNSLSFDNLFRKLKYSSVKKEYHPNRKVSSLAYYIILLIIPAIVYLESALNWKIISPVWNRGLGMWLPASIPYLVQADLSPILNLKYFNLFCGYLTIVFEILFIFLFWYRKMRWPLIIVGVGLHIGILVFFPIPLFAFGMISFYFLLIPVGVWGKMYRFFVKPGNYSLKFYYDNECPICLRTKIIIEHFDIFKKVQFLTIQNDSETEPALNKTNKADLLKNIYSVSKNDKVYKGINTYIRVLFAMRYTFLLGIILCIPGIYHIARYIYNKIAGARYTQRCTEESCVIAPVMLPVNRDEQHIFINYTVKDLKVDSIKWGILIIFFLQFCISSNYGLMSKFSQAVGLPKTFFINRIGNAVINPARFILGLGQHAVYMEQAYYGYELKISHIDKNGVKIVLPIIKDNGLDGGYVYGPNYVSYLFACVSKNSIVNGNDLVVTFDKANLNDRLGPWITFWEKKHHIKPGDENYVIDLKEFNIPKEWKKDFLKDAMKQPWIEIGTFNLNKEDKGLDIQFNQEGNKRLGRTIVNDL